MGILLNGMEWITKMTKRGEDQLLGFAIKTFPPKPCLYHLDAFHSIALL
jgi:hypothetical protein